MKKFFIYLFLFFPATVFCQKNLVVTALFENKITISIPADLKKVQEDLSNKPQYIFADEKKKISLMVTLNSGFLVDDNDIPAYGDTSITDIKKASGITIIDDGISLNAGKNIGFVKYNREKGEDEGFNYIFYGSMNGKLVAFRFSCPTKLRNDWENVMDKVVASLVIRDAE